MSVYTLDILRLATETARWPRLALADVTGEARAPVCGSMITVDLSLNGTAIAAIGMDVRACALGQASAALLARSVSGIEEHGIAKARAELASWLTGETSAPGDWPDLSLLEPARALTARYGAMLLPFDATLAAFALLRVKA
jgi:NifU-like protein involved in Fe-S cluster formation